MLIPVVIAIALVAMSAALVAYGAALAAVDRGELRSRADAGDRRAGRTLASFTTSGAEFTEIQLGVLLCTVALGALAEPFVDELIGPVVADGSGAAGDPARAWSVLAALVLAAGVQVVPGGMAARSVGAQRPMGTLALLGPPARLLTRALVPVAALVDAIAQRATAALAADPRAVRSRIRSRQELRRLVHQSERGGAIDPVDAEQFDRALRFADKTAADAFTPRVEVESLPLDSTVGDLVDLSIATGFSRFPVTGEDLDDVVGIVHVKDVLGLPAEGRRDVPIEELVRPVLAVPETKPLESLMAELRRSAGQFALVVDEYGGTAGTITLEDVIEEIVGDISDEHDPALSAPSVRRWGGAHLLDGSLHRDEVLDACGFEVPDGDYDTLGGFVMASLGRIPEPGDAFTHDGWAIEVDEMESHRIRTVRLVAPSPGAIGAERGRGRAPGGEVAS